MTFTAILVPGQSSRDWLLIRYFPFHPSLFSRCRHCRLQAGRAAHLEVRLAEHTAPQLHIKDGNLISEPPSIEGYVTRAKAPSGTHEEVYLTVHNGLLFTLRPTHANAPNPPGAIPVPFDSNKDAPEVLREDEVRRGAKQVLAARDMTDLRAVVAVRRAFRPVFLPEHDSTGPDSGVEEQDGEVTHEETDTQDVGGDAGLTTGDVTIIRMRRCFELVMKTGHIMRFEVRPYQTILEVYFDQADRGGMADMVCPSRHRMD